MPSTPLMKACLADVEVAMIKLGNGLPMVPLASIKSDDWQRRWAAAQTKRESGERLGATIQKLLEEACGLIAPDFLIRAAQRNPIPWKHGQAPDSGPLTTARGK
jgi:hypothetical protein